MKFIKQIWPTLLLSIILFLFTQCVTTKKAKETIPFTVDKAYIEQTNASTNLYILLSANNNIVLDSAYYQNKIQKLHLLKENLYVAHFSNEKKIKNDFNLSDNPLKEYGNTVSNSTKKPPLNISKTECVISYKLDNNSKYYKITKVENNPTNTTATPTSNKQ